MVKRWRIHPHDPDRIARLKHAADVPSVVAQLLICRGISDPREAEVFLDPKLTALHAPELLPGCSTAAEFLAEAIHDRRRIIIYGDYDVDGMTGTAIMHQCLTLLGADVGYFIPNRMDDGYGLNNDAIRQLADRGAQVIVSVDCGIASVEEALTARECGVDLIITDHHEPNAELPDAVAIVHPRLPGHDYPFGGLAGSGVALKLAWALCQQASGAKRVNPAMRNYLISAVGLAAMGAVADVVPLIDENRILVRHGLNSLQQQPSLGVATLMKVAKIHNKPKLDAEDIGFALAPRLNAAGRMGQATLGVELLITDRPERAQELAKYIDGLNETRKSLERKIFRAANKQAKEEFDPKNDAALVLADRGWHAGVIGIVAGRLAERHHRPVVLISWNELGVKPGIGSARSVPGFDLHAALEVCDEHLLGHGGHAAAAGLQIDEAKLDAFRADFVEHAAAEITESQRMAEIHIDAEAPLSAFTLKIVRQIEQLGPFGAANTRPLLCTDNVTLAEPPKKIGVGGNHLALKLNQHGVTLRAVAFGAGDWADELAALEGPIDIAFRPVVNSFAGRHNVELHLVDWRAV